MSEERSTYVLNVWGDYAAGVEWNDEHVYSDPSHLEWFVRRICENTKFQAFYLVLAAVEIGIFVIRRGVAVERVNVRPFIYLALDGAGPYPLDDEEAITRPLVNAASVVYGRPVPREDEPVSLGMFGGDLWWLSGVFEQVELFVDWPALLAKLPRLEAPLLGPRESMEVANPKRFSLFGHEPIYFGSIGWMGEPIEDLPPGVEPVERDDDDYEEGDEEFEDEDDNGDDGEA